MDLCNFYCSAIFFPFPFNLFLLNGLAKIMRQRHIDRGALTLASAEVKFQIDTETHDPLDIGIILFFFNSL